MKKTIAVIILMIYLLGVSNVYADKSSVFETNAGGDVPEIAHFIDYIKHQRAKTGTSPNTTGN